MISIIIVHYQVKKELFECIQSILKSKTKTPYEIIVVDNDKQKTIKAELKEKFPKVIYIPNENRGFGQGNNIGAKKAKGEYIYFLNPDTKVFEKSIDILVNFLIKHKDVGVVAPFLVDKNNKAYPQGARELTPLASIFGFSFIHKLFPNNLISRKYWMIGEWDRISIKEVASVPGTAFMIRNNIFKKIKGFDEKFFMYFEEHDLCKRVTALGWKIIMLPEAKVYHALGRSSKQISSIGSIFRQSRFYFFKKHYGLTKALLTEGIMRTSKYTFMLAALLLIGIVLLLYRLPELMPFIGDHGWFYLSARDIITSGTIPLVGIATSHPWLHQGPLWTYLLAVAFAITHFNPLSGAYVSILFGIFSIILIYKVGSSMFSSRVGIIAALLYATSPLVIFNARTPYHTAPISFFTLLYLLFLFNWLQGRKNYLPLVIFILAVLFNLEIATFLLTITFMIIIVYLLLKNKKLIITSLTPKIVGLSIIGFLIPMMPMLLYDVSHGYPQTIKFWAWNIYKIATVFGYQPIHETSTKGDFRIVLLFIAESYKKLVYLPSNLVAFTIAIFSFGFLSKDIIDSIRSKKANMSLFILGLITIIAIIGILASKTVSDAYLPILYAPVMLITALFFDKLLILRPRLTFPIILILLTISSMNAFTLINDNFLIAHGEGLAKRLAGAKEIVTESQGRRYNLVGKGNGSQFQSFTMNYEYLTWWLGNGPSHKPENIKLVLAEDNNGIFIKKIIKK
jgi:GT2 family glycosyltransferase